ncbi:MAG TPA: ATPase P [Syntrophomonadaceae bacterium]|nr:ATPase P [Syntrophomonadaceae bacterium]
MLQVSLPGRNKNLQLKNLVLDINGTLTLDGELISGVEQRLEVLKSSFDIYLLSADTYGCAKQVACQLGLELFRVDAEEGGSDKKDFLSNLGPDESVAIGNGFNDIYMLETAGLAIVVIGIEGCSIQALNRADIAVGHIHDALDLLIHPKRLIATLRA